MKLCLVHDAIVVAIKEDEIYWWDEDKCTWRKNKLKKDRDPIIKLEGGASATATLEDWYEDSETYLFSIRIDSDINGNKFDKPVECSLRAKSIPSLIKAFKKIGIHITKIYEEVDGLLFEHDVDFEKYQEKKNKKNLKKGK